jgi:N-methylhydantoinase A
MRYVGQGYELRVSVPQSAPTAEQLVQLFHERYEGAYGYSAEGQPVEVVTWHVSVTQQADRVAFSATPDERSPREPDATRLAYFPETGLGETAVHERSRLVVGDTLQGPCLVAETTTTTVVLPGDTVVVAPDSSLLVHVGQR